MSLQNKDRYSLAEAYNQVKECECQHADTMKNIQNSSEERVDMILNNLVNLNNKAAELVGLIQTSIDAGEGIDEWVSEKIAVATSMIGNINDYYAKYNSAFSGNAKVMSSGASSGLTTAYNNLGNSESIPITIAI